MATYKLINAIQFGSSLLWPGSVIDSVQDDLVGLQAAGGICVATGNSTIDAASADALSVKMRGGDMALAGAIMLGALATAAVLNPGSVGEAELANLAVTEGKIGALAVTEGKLGAGAVTNAKIGALAVTVDKFANGAGLGALLAAGLGNSIVVTQASADPTLLAADAVNARAIIIVAQVTVDLLTTAAFVVESVGGVTLLDIPALTPIGTYIGAGVVPADVANSLVRVNATAGGAGTVSVTGLAFPTA